MTNKFSSILVLVLSAVIALIGLFMAARAEDGLFAFHGWIMVIFGVVMCFNVAGRMTQD